MVTETDGTINFEDILLILIVDPLRPSIDSRIETDTDTPNRSVSRPICNDTDITKLYRN